jgi:tRNA-modifying protein YgfZ
MTVDFGNATQDANQVYLPNQVYLYDRTHWGRIRVTDRDRLTFLHNQSTQMLNLRKPGEVCETTFVTSTARTLDLATVAVLEESAIVVVSPQMAEKLIAFLDRYIFFADQVKLTDITSETVMLSLIGSGSDAILKNLGLDPSTGVTEGTIAGVIVTVIAGSGLVNPGYTIVAAVADRETLWQALTPMAAIMDDATFERLRIEQGRPMPGAELTEDYNPLDAGLWNTVSFNKGCYIGQETIARLESRDAVKMGLWGVKLNHPVEAGTTVFVNGDKAGTMTSVYDLGDEGAIGLCYVRTKAAGVGAIVQVGMEDKLQTATLLDLPFVVRGRR